MVDLKVDWKPRNENTLMGKPILRADGIQKASGAAKYSTDYTENALVALLLTSPHAHAMITSLDVEPAKKITGVKAVYVFPGRAPGDGDDYELQWMGDPIVAVAAETARQAAEGVKAIKIEYDVLDHFVDEFDLAGAVENGRTKPGRNVSVDGDPDKAIAEADVVHRGYYGIHTITHCCLEPHGSTCKWEGDNKLHVELSTQNVSGTNGQFAGPLGLEAANVSVHCDYIGGGFGSKFAADEWGVACAQLAKDAGQPVQTALGP